MRSIPSVLLFLVALAPPSAAQTTVTIQPTLDSNDATVTFVGGPGPTIPTLSAFGTCGPTGAAGIYRAFHEYDLSGIPPGATILSATHNLYIAQYCTPSSQAMAAYRVLTPWSESTITWANQPAHDPTPFGARLAGNAATSPLGYNAWDVTGLVQFWVDNPGSNRGLVMRAVDESTPIAAVAALTGESGAATAPYLQITYTGGGSVLGNDQAVVVNQGGQTVSVIDATNLSVVSSVAMGSDVIDAAVTPDGTRAIVTSFVARTATILGLTSSPPTILGSFSLPIASEDVSVSCTKNYALITDGLDQSGQGSDAFVVSVDISAQTVVQTLQLPVPAQGVEVTPDGTLGLVASFVTGTLRVLTISPTGTLADTGQSIPVGSCVNVAIAPDGRSALVADVLGDTVVLLGISGTTVTKVQTIAVPPTPQSIGYAPDGTRAYVVHSVGSLITELDTSTSGSVSVVGSRSHGGTDAQPFFGVDQIAVSTDGARVLVRATDEVAVFDAATDVLLGSIPVSGSGGIAVRCTHLVNPNLPPAADAGPDQTLQCTSGGTVVTLDGSNSTDPDGDPLTYEWVVATGTATITDPNSAVTTATIPDVGPVMFTLNVSDGNGGLDSDDVVVTVEDTTPPVVVATTDVATLWPPNHMYTPVSLGLQVDENCDPNTLTVTCKISSSEPDDANGDGFFTGDVEINGVGYDAYAAEVAVPLTLIGPEAFGSTINLRAERDGKNSSRTYSIVCTVTDASGNTSTASCVVVVPHDRSGK